MRRFTLIADDLTGALDSAARFVIRFGSIPVVWRESPSGEACAFDTGTREADEAIAVARHTCLAPLLHDTELVFKKLDSLLRGHVGPEIAACRAAGGFDHVIIAPAFPFQGRTTCRGQQMVHGEPVSLDLTAALARHGLAARLCRPGDRAPPGVSLWDAASDADLAAIAAAGRALAGRVLWCGTGGLAGALAPGLVPSPALTAPTLALIGSDHPVSHAQLAATSRHVVLDADAPLILPAAVSLALPGGLSRGEAAARIAASFTALARRLPRPGSLVVAGGETLRGLCDGLGASALTVLGEHEPGAPISRMEGGHWHGLPILSKSGAFGAPDFLARLLGG